MVITSNPRTACFLYLYDAGLRHTCACQNHEHNQLGRAVNLTLEASTMRATTVALGAGCEWSANLQDAGETPHSTRSVHPAWADIVTDPSGCVIMKPTII